jgi:phosphate uptake regulator
MKRKVVQHGNTTLTLSLPSKWVKNNNVKKGDFLNLEMTEKGILINSKIIKFGSVELDLSNEEKWYIHRILTHLYNYGFDEIKINYSNKKIISIIREKLKELSGFEVIECASNYCKIKSMTFAGESEFNNTIKRIFWQILSQYDSFIEDAEKSKYSNYEESLEVNKVIIKLINLSKRILNKNEIFGRITSKYFHNLNTSLLNISRSLIYSYERANKEKSVFSIEEISLMKKLRELYQVLSGAYTDLDLEKIKIFLNERELIIEDSLKLLQGKNPIIMHFFLDLFKEFSSISNYVIASNLNKEDTLRKN